MRDVGKTSSFVEVCRTIDEMEVIFLDKSIILKLVNEVTEEVFAKNKEALEDETILTANVELAVRLSALTTIKILERLELIDAD